MRHETRNHSVAGVALLIGAAVVAFGATQPWATGTGALVGRWAGLEVSQSLGFDVLLGPGGRYGDVKPLLLGSAAALAVLALLLFATRVPGLGVLWRLLALTTLVLIGFTAVAAWSVVKNPASVIADPESPLGRALGLAETFLGSTGLAQIRPGIGLWLLTVGSGIAAIGALIPAARGYRPESNLWLGGLQSQPTVARMPAGWYTDQLDRRFVRFFDGVQWTGSTRPRA